jgi:hypothetical protein
MTRIVISDEKKKELLADAESGQGIASWMFGFIRHDPEFQAELFRKAENAKNWRFLASLSDFREAARRKAIAASPVQASPTQLRRAVRQQSSRRSTAAKLRPLRRSYSSTLPTQQPLDPRTLPSRMVIRVRSSDFTNCPRCKLHLLKKVLKDHLEMACPRRNLGGVGNVSGGKTRNASGRVFCRCGALAIPGDTCCYDHKHN